LLKKYLFAKLVLAATHSQELKISFAMREVQYIIALFLLEILIFGTELLFSFYNQKNRKLKKATSVNEVDFIDLSEGYRTSISFFRISIFISYLILVFIYLDISRESTIERYIMIIIFGILVYLVSLYNVKTFIFYSDYFIVTAPFNFFQKDIIVNYYTIKSFTLYRALYNSFYLKLEYKNGNKQRIQFSGAFNPRNDLVIRLILNTRIGLFKKLDHSMSEKK
jgi:hypothetical protein